MNKMSATRRRLPFGPLISTRTVWRVAGSWAPLLGLIMALLDLDGRRPFSLQRIAVHWDALTLLLIRIMVSYAAANKAFASRTRWRAMAWTASGAAIVVLLAPYGNLTPTDEPPGREWDPWEDTRIYAALAAAWYSLFAILLYRPAVRSSHEQADYGVALAALWVALPILAKNSELQNFMPAYLAYRAYHALATTTVLLFGYRGWFFSVSILDCHGVGAWMDCCNSRCFLLGVHLALVGLLPIAVALLIFLRIIGRRRWVRLVEDGRIAGWRLLDATIPRPAGIPVLTGDGQGAVKVLARVPDTAHPLQADAEPVALVAVSRDHGPEAARESG